MVLPVPGGPQNTSEPSERVAEHAGEHAVGAEQLILPYDLCELLRTQLVRERTRRIVFQSCCREQVVSAAFGARAHPPNWTASLLPAAHQHQPPLAAFLLGDLIEIARLLDRLVVHGDDDIATPEAQTLRRRAIGDVENGDTFGAGIEPQFVGQRRRQITYLHAREGRARLDDDLFTRACPAH